MSNQCIFCGIAAGTVPGKIVHQDDDFVAFADIQPKAETHILVIPREHHSDLDAYVDGGDPAGMLRFVRDTASAAGVSGRYRLITNVGQEAGQDVFHLHWHILAGDDLPGF